MSYYTLIKRRGIVQHFFGGYVEQKLRFDYIYPLPKSSGAIREMLEGFLSQVSGAKSGKYTLRNEAGKTIWSGKLNVNHQNHA